MAAVDEGRERVSTKAHSRRCTHEKLDGSGCKAWAMRGSQFCHWHSLTPAQQAEQVSRGGHASVAVRRAKKEGRARSGLRPGVNLQRVMEVAADLLTAEVAVIDEPDYPARALGALILISTFKREFRQTPEKAKETLQRALPLYLEQDEWDELRASVQCGLEEARRAWLANEGGIRNLTGLFDDKWPEGFVGPWEDRAQLDRELQAHLRKERAAT